MIWAVLDTNVLVSGLGWRNTVPAHLVDQALAGRFLLVTSPDLLAEVDRVLRYPKLAPVLSEPAAIIDLIRRVSVVVTPGARLSVVNDEPDNRLLEVAVEARADAIITGDRHVLSLGAEYEGIKLMQPRQFLELLEEQPS